MSRSNPTLNTPHPSQKWMDWKGGDNFGLGYYDKEKKERVPIPLPFTFILLDQLAGVAGYNNKAGTGIKSNEVRDTSEEPLVVRLMTGAIIAEGFWSEIKEKVKGSGGKFCANAYLAFKDGNGLKIGCLKLSGCALGPWFDFTKDNRATVESPFEKGLQVPRIYSAAIKCQAGAENSEGPIPFTPPSFSIVGCSAETNLAAMTLDRQLQVYLDEYFKRPRKEQAHEPEEEKEEEAPPESEKDEPDLSDDDIPF